MMTNLHQNHKDDATNDEKDLVSGITSERW